MPSALPAILTSATVSGALPAPARALAAPARISSLTPNVPHLNDYSPDPRNNNDSSKAFAGLIADVNSLPTADPNDPDPDPKTMRATGIVPVGCFSVSGWQGALLPGAYLQGTPCGPDNGTDVRGYGRVGSAIAIPKNSKMVNGMPVQMQPWATFCKSSGCQDLTFLQPDQASTPLDASGYGKSADPEQWFVGAPDPYAPALVADFNHNPDGTRGRLNGGRIKWRDIQLPGVYDGVYVRDDNLGQMAVGDLDIQNVRGYCIRHGFVTGQVGVQSLIQNVRLSPAYWTDSLTQNSSWQAWRMENGYDFWIRNRGVGLNLSQVSVRVGRAVIRLSGGGGERAHDPGFIYDGIESGRLNSASVLRVNVEEHPTFLLVDEDAYMNDVQFKDIKGHFMNHSNPNCVYPVIDIQTDKTVAGQWNHASPPAFISMAQSPGSPVLFELFIQESMGPILAVGAADGHGMINVTGFVKGWGKGGPQPHGANKFRTIPAFQISPDALAKLKHYSAEVYPTAQGSNVVYDVGLKEKLRAVGVDYFGVKTLSTGTPPLLSIDDPATFTGCVMHPEMAADAAADPA